MNFGLDDDVQITSGCELVTGIVIGIGSRERIEVTINGKVHEVQRSDIKVIRPNPVASVLLKDGSVVDVPVGEVKKV